MNYIAEIVDGMNQRTSIRVTSVSVKIGGEWDHKPTHESVGCLLVEARMTGQLCIYTGGRLLGQISAAPGIPLYSNGQEKVALLKKDGIVIWDAKKIP